MVKWGGDDVVSLKLPVVMTAAQSSVQYWMLMIVCHFYLGIVALSPGIGGVRDVASAIISHEQTHSDRVC